MSGWRGRNVRWHGRMPDWRGRNVRWRGRNLRLRQPSYPTYHLHSASPHQQAIPIPAARKGPNGISSLPSALPGGAPRKILPPEAHRTQRPQPSPPAPGRSRRQPGTSHPRRRKPRARSGEEEGRSRRPQGRQAPLLPGPQALLQIPQGPSTLSQPDQGLPAPLQAHPGAFAPSRPSMPPLPQGQQNPRFRQYLSNSISFSYSYCQ